MHPFILFHSECYSWACIDLPLSFIYSFCLFPISSKVHQRSLPARGNWLCSGAWGNWESPTIDVALFELRFELWFDQDESCFCSRRRFGSGEGRRETFSRFFATPSITIERCHIHAHTKSFWSRIIVIFTVRQRICYLSTVLQQLVTEYNLHMNSQTKTTLNLFCYLHIENYLLKVCDARTSIQLF